MIAVEPADLVTWTTLLGFAIALFAYLGTMKRDLRLGDLKPRMCEVREEVRVGHAAIGTEVSKLEQRTFDLGLNQEPHAG